MQKELEFFDESAFTIFHPRVFAIENPIIPGASDGPCHENNHLHWKGFTYPSFEHCDILLLLLERSILIPMEAQQASVKEMHGRLHLPDAHFAGIRF
jgi:hypothetical protein